VEVEVDLAIAKRLVGASVHSYSLLPLRLIEPLANCRSIEPAFTDSAHRLTKTKRYHFSGNMQRHN